MTWDRIEDNWDYFAPRVRVHWRRLSEQVIAHTAGNRDRLVEAIARAYGMSPAQASREVEAWSGLVKLRAAA